MAMEKCFSTWRPQTPEVLLKTFSILSFHFNDLKSLPCDKKGEALSFLWRNSFPLLGYTTLYLSADDHLGFSILGATYQKCCCKQLHANFYVTMSSVLLGIHLGVELLGHIITLFNILRNCQIVLHNGYTTLSSHQQCTSIPISSHSHQKFPILKFYFIAILVGVKMVSHYNFTLITFP